MTKLEEIARAAFQKASEQRYGLWFSSLEWDDVPQIHDVFTDTTRAVIEAMREPTEAITEQGAKRVDYDEEDEAFDNVVARNVWQAMIDAILNEKTE